MYAGYFCAHGFGVQLLGSLLGVSTPLPTTLLSSYNSLIFLPLLPRSRALCSYVNPLGAQFASIPPSTLQTGILSSYCFAVGCVHPPYGDQSWKDCT